MTTNIQLAQRPDDGCGTPLSAIDVSDPAIYQQDTWQLLFARLRREAPVHYCALTRGHKRWLDGRLRAP